MTVTIRVGDAWSELANLAPKSVQCVVTSPPYWNLRDYGTAEWVGGDDPDCDHLTVDKIRPRSERPNPTGAGIGKGGATFDAQEFASLVARETCPKCGARRVDDQLGLEPTVDAYVDRLVDIFREVWRVLRDDGVVWLNLGDTYAGAGYSNHRGTGGAQREDGGKQHHTPAVSLKPKDLVGVPWRVALALQADGWWLRSDIIWHKPNPMPESVTDRPTKAHEYIFLLSKSERYFYDSEAIREDGEGYGLCLRFRGTRYQNNASFVNSGDGSITFGGGRTLDPDYRRNRRTVWTIPTYPFPGAHFATFPPDLVEPCVMAGTSERGRCPECGAPWERIVETTVEPDPQRHTGRAAVGLLDRGDADAERTIVTKRETVGWSPTCDCGSSDVEDGDLVWRPHDPIPCVVLDPFGGAGTVGLVADRLGRDSILIELSRDYAYMARDRIVGDAPLFTRYNVVMVDDEGGT